MDIRVWEEKDVSAIEEIERRCFPSDAWTSAMLSDALKTPHYWSILAEDRGQVCGYACLLTLFETAEVLNIAVDTPYRGRGIGAALLEKMHEKAKELGAERSLLEVRVSNAPAIALYEKFGYRKIAVRKGYYSNGEDANIMQKDF